MSGEGFRCSVFNWYIGIITIFISYLVILNGVGMSVYDEEENVRACVFVAFANFKGGTKEAKVEI